MAKSTKMTVSRATRMLKSGAVVIEYKRKGYGSFFKFFNNRTKAFKYAKAFGGKYYRAFQKTNSGTIREI